MSPKELHYKVHTILNDRSAHDIHYKSLDKAIQCATYLVRNDGDNLVSSSAVFDRNTGAMMFQVDHKTDSTDGEILSVSA